MQKIYTIGFQKNGDEFVLRNIGDAATDLLFENLKYIGMVEVGEGIIFTWDYYAPEYKESIVDTVEAIVASKGWKGTTLIYKLN